MVSTPQAHQVHHSVTGPHDRELAFYIYVVYTSRLEDLDLDTSRRAATYPRPTYPRPTYPGAGPSVPLGLAPSASSWREGVVRI